MEIQNVITLIDAVSAADIMNFQMEEGNFKLTIDKVNARIDSSSALQAMPVVAAPFVQEAPHRGNNDAHEVISVSGNVKEEEVKKSVESCDVNVKEIKSPIVGTFYAAAGPEEADFAKIGTQVKAGQVVCIIEAMKLMNEIESDYEGEIVEILVNNEQMVEYNQPLYKVKVK